MQSDDVLQRYRHLRQLTIDIHAAALKHIAKKAMLQHARGLGLAHGQRIVATEEESYLLLDLAIHGGQRGRPRPIDRCQPPAGDPEAAAVLRAMRKSRFSLWALDRLHHTAGVVLRDTINEEDVWLVDEGMTANLSADLVFAGRVFWPDQFAITTGVIAPVSIESVIETIADCAGWISNGFADFSADPRFATAIYRNAMEFGDTDQVVCQAIPKAA